jgi:hypothetical protein
MIDAGVSSVLSEDARPREANMLTQRRRSKNSGGGIAPAAIGALIEGTLCSVNAFEAVRSRRARPENADKVLIRLNFRRYPVNA